jgi:hypothetical protein
MGIGRLRNQGIMKIRVIKWSKHVKSMVYEVFYFFETMVYEVTMSRI